MKQKIVQNIVPVSQYQLFNQAQNGVQNLRKRSAQRSRSNPRPSPLNIINNRAQIQQPQIHSGQISAIGVNNLNQKDHFQFHANTSLNRHQSNGSGYVQNTSNIQQQALPSAAQYSHILASQQSQAKLGPQRGKSGRQTQITQATNEFTPSQLQIKQKLKNPVFVKTNLNGQQSESSRNSKTIDDQSMDAVKEYIHANTTKNAQTITAQNMMQEFLNSQTIAQHLQNTQSKKQGLNANQQRTPGNLPMQQQDFNSMLQGFQLYANASGSIQQNNQQQQPTLVFQQNNIITQTVDMNQLGGVQQKQQPPVHSLGRLIQQTPKQYQAGQQFNTVPNMIPVHEQELTNMQELYHQIKPSSRGGPGQVVLRKSAQRRLNSTLDNYKKINLQTTPTVGIPNVQSGRINQNMILEQAQTGLQTQFLQHLVNVTDNKTLQGNTTNTRSRTNSTLKGTEVQIKQRPLNLIAQQTEIKRAQSNIRDPGTQIESYLNEQLRNQQQMIQQMMNQNGQNQLHQLQAQQNAASAQNRLKQKRSESVVTQRQGAPDIRSRQNSNLTTLTGNTPSNITAGQSLGINVEQNYTTLKQQQKNGQKFVQIVGAKNFSTLDVIESRESQLRQSGQSKQKSTVQVVNLIPSSEQKQAKQPGRQIIQRKDINQGQLKIESGKNIDKALFEELTGTLGMQIAVDNRTRIDSHNGGNMLQQRQKTQKSDNGQVGNHLIVNSSNSPDRKMGKLAQIFNGSDEWTDLRIQEFTDHLKANRDNKTGILSPVQQQTSDERRRQGNTIIQYETFESSSGGEEAEQCIFESEALSFQNQQKLQNSHEKEVKRIERQKRKYRKMEDKVKAQKYEERQKRKRTNALHLRVEQLNDTIDDDVLQFQDSDRDSVIGYFQPRGKSIKPVDTPTRLLNNSNDFLPIESIDLPTMSNPKDEVVTPRRELKELKAKLQLLFENQPISEGKKSKY